MTNDTTTKKRDLKPVEVGVGAGAAVITAFATSYLGTAGTLTGAALASVVGTVSTSVLRKSADRSAEKLRRTTVRLRETGRVGPELGRRSAGTATAATTTTHDIDPYGTQLFGAGDLSGTPLPGAAAAAGPMAVPATGGVVGPTTGSPAATGGPDARPAGTQVGPDGSPAAGVGDRTGRPKWLALAAGAVVAFAVALVAITGIEAAAGKPLAGLVGKETGGGTTIGRVTGTDSGSTKKSPTPTVTPTGEPTATSTGTTPSAESTPTGEPTAPESTTAPSATSPAPSATVPAPAPPATTDPFTSATLAATP